MLPRVIRSAPRSREMLGLRSAFVNGPVTNAAGRNMISKRTLISAPRTGDGPLMERRGDRELPEVAQPGMRWLLTLPIFVGILTASTLAIFNYQKGSSSVVSSNLYALRTSPKARELLGDEIYFAHKMPWIWGEMNQLHGRINIHFAVKGNKAQGTMRFKSQRDGRRGMWETEEWSLEMDSEEGKKIDLLDAEDVFKGLELDEEVGDKKVGRGLYAPTLSS